MLGAFDWFHFDLEFVPSSRFRNSNPEFLAVLTGAYMSGTVYVERNESMTQAQKWPRIAVVGAGAVGGYFGGVFARSGAPIVFIGRQHFADAVNVNGLVLHTAQGDEQIPAKATTAMSAVRDCSLILFCVKANDTSTTATQMAPFVRPDTTVVCLQNGVDNAQRVHAATNLVSLSAVVYVAVSVPEPGRVKHLARG